MPQATNLVLKNAAAVDKTFALATPAGPTGSALWYLREGANPGVFPKIECSSRPLQGGAGRKIQLSLSVPAPVTSASGAVTAVGRISFNLDVAVPDSIPDGVRDDAIAFVGNLLKTSLMAAVFKDGFAPT